MLTVAKSGLTMLIEISETKAKLVNYLKEKCSSEHYHKISFKYSVEAFLISK